MLIPQRREQVWRALTDSATLAEWMFKNDFAPLIGHHFTFQVPLSPKAGFDGIVVRCTIVMRPNQAVQKTAAAGRLIRIRSSLGPHRC